MLVNAFFYDLFGAQGCAVISNPGRASWAPKARGWSRYICTATGRERRLRMVAISHEVWLVFAARSVRTAWSGSSKSGVAPCRSRYRPWLLGMPAQGSLCLSLFRLRPQPPNPILDISFAASHNRHCRRSSGRRACSGTRTIVSAWTPVAGTDRFAAVPPRGLLAAIPAPPPGGTLLLTGSEGKSSCGRCSQGRFTARR